MIAIRKADAIPPAWCASASMATRVAIVPSSRVLSVTRGQTRLRAWISLISRQSAPTWARVIVLLVNVFAERDGKAMHARESHAPVLAAT